MSKTENINIMSSSSSSDDNWTPEYGEESEKLLN